MGPFKIADKFIDVTYIRRFWDLTKVLFPQDNWVQDLTPLKDTESTFDTTPVMLSNFRFTDRI